MALKGKIIGNNTIINLHALFLDEMLTKIIGLKSIQKVFGRNGVIQN
jgi:hypothetical protein